jgi:hypothetical protein
LGHARPSPPKRTHIHIATAPAASSSFTTASSKTISSSKSDSANRSPLRH